MSLCERASIQIANGLAAFLIADSHVYEDGFRYLVGQVKKAGMGTIRLSSKILLLLCGLLSVDAFKSHLATGNKACESAKEQLLLSGVSRVLVKI